MGLSSAVQWWDEWQMRILALGSLGIQYLLWIFSRRRKFSIPPWCRLFIWLSFLGSDALAIYALAALFNRQKLHRHVDHDLEVFWAPVLLMHLGGPMFITAYNIEDNELWRRHIVTALSQITVAVYVFSNSWPSSADKGLLAAAILLFIPGILKCMEKPWALKSASFNSLTTSSDPALPTTTANREKELEDYVAEARAFIQRNDPPPKLDNETKRFKRRMLRPPKELFPDFVSSYSVRRTNVELFWVLDDMTAYKSLKDGLSEIFDLLYTKVKMGEGSGPWIWILSFLLPIAAIVLFHVSHKKAYSGSDVIVTFVLLYGTLMLEFISLRMIRRFEDKWPDMVAQHSIIRFFARNKKHTRLMSITRFLRCQDLLDQYYLCMKPCNSAPRITKLVRGYVRKGWKEYIRDEESYRKFNDIRGHGTLEREGCDRSLGWSLERPFDESILLWHLATDFCSRASHEAYYSKRGREISNYMMHLLFANPEMLMHGTRKNLHKAAYDELESIFEVQDGEKLPLGAHELTQKIVDKVNAAGSEEDGFIYDAWKLAQGLTDLCDEKKMWGVIEGVWVEMLCFSASRCRGYLHAKSLGSGVEYLSFVWLLLAYAGMETFADKLQRTQLRVEGETAAPPSPLRGEGAAAPELDEIVVVELVQGTQLSKERTQLQDRGENAAGPSTSRCEGAAAPELDEIVVIEMVYDTNSYSISN